MKKLFFIFSILFALEGSAQDYKAIHTEFMDKTVRPQDDFYNYINGNWMKNTEIPSDRSSWGSFSELEEKTDEATLLLLKKLLSKKYSMGSDEQKIGDLYHTYVDFDTRNKLGITPIKPFLNKIDQIKNLAGLQKYLIEMTPKGANPFYKYEVFNHLEKSNIYAVYFGGPILGMGRSYYQKEDETNKDALIKYSDFISKLRKQYDKKPNKKLANEIVAFEKFMAKSLLPLEQTRNIKLLNNPYALNDLSKLCKNIDLKGYFLGCGIKIDTVIITEIEYIKNLDNFLNTKNIPIIKEFLKFNLINNTAGFLTKELDEINFDFYSRILNGQKEQRSLDKRALEFVNGQVGELLGKIYIKNHFTQEAKDNAKEMINYLFKSFDMHIKNLSWMSEETKVKALDKLNKFQVKIGYPDKWKDYSTLKINPSSLFDNLTQIVNWHYVKDKGRIGKQVDRTEWGMPPQQVNAYYNPLSNEIVFPAAILQAPFYDYKADAAVNFGGIGAVIGHEISHGFDDSGAQFDGNGNLNNWWTETDAAKFSAAGKALSDQYDKYEPIKDIHVNGAYTLGENIGDLGGVAVSYDALLLYLKDHNNSKSIDGFTPEQRFFISWATIWRTKLTEEALKNLIKTDPHSPGYYRSFGPLVNVDGFYNAFNIQPTDNHFKPESERIKIW